MSHHHHHHHNGSRRKVALILAASLLLAVAAWVEHALALPTWQLLLVYLDTGAEMVTASWAAASELSGRG